MEYFVNEGSFNLPLDGRIDRTLNVLAFPDGSAATFLLSRDELRTDETLQQFVERQLAELAGQVKGYQSVTAPTPFAVRAGVSEAIEFAGQFSQNGQAIHQRQAALRLTGTQRVLILTLSGFEPFDPPTLKLWADAVNSFKPR